MNLVEIVSPASQEDKKTKRITSPPSYPCHHDGIGAFSSSHFSAPGWLWTCVSQARNVMILQTVLQTGALRGGGSGGVGKGGRGGR